MSQLATTKMSSKGQVVIPEEIRTALHLVSGANFIAIGRGDTVILKLISEPPLGAIKDLLDEASRKAKKAGLERSDIKKAIEKG
jgi:AbrB family looped-hinge helix DNA binding protein